MVAVGYHKKGSVCTLRATGAAHTAAILVLMVVAAIPAFHAAFPGRVNLSGQDVAEHNQTHEDAANPYCELVFHTGSSSIPVKS